MSNPHGETAQCRDFPAERHFWHWHLKIRKNRYESFLVLSKIASFLNFSQNTVKKIADSLQALK